MQVLDLVTKELKQFIKFGPTETELESAKRYAVNRVLMSFDHPGAIAGWIETDLLWEDALISPEEYAKVLEKINLESIDTLMNNYWDLSKLNLIVQGPIKSTKSTVKKLEQLIAEIG